MLQVKSHAAAWPFLKPVDKNEVPDYYDHIKYPMGEYSLSACCGPREQPLCLQTLRPWVNVWRTTTMPASGSLWQTCHACSSIVGCTTALTPSTTVAPTSWRNTSRPAWEKWASGTNSRVRGPALQDPLGLWGVGPRPLAPPPVQQRASCCFPMSRQSSPSAVSDNAGYTETVQNSVSDLNHHQSDFKSLN